MNNPFRVKQINRVVLEALQHAAPYALPESTLQAHCNGMLRPPPGPKEWEERLSDLESREAIVVIPDDLDPNLKQWAITSLGRTIFATF